jgi:ubiquinone/menaquinone biosynthesis C-methylase UbiE
MARANHRLNRMAVRVLRVQPQDAVLEIGFGPGDALELLVKRTPARKIAGVDPSQEMVDQASARNRESIEAGRVSLFEATAERLPFDDAQFSKAFAVSNFLIWNSPDRGLAEIFRVLKPEGQIVICQRRAPRRRHWWSSPGVTKEELRLATEMLIDAGFESVRQVHAPIKRRLVCLVGHKC